MVEFVKKKFENRNGIISFEIKDTETKKVRPPVVSYQDYVNGNYFTNNKALDFFSVLVYNVN